MAQSVILQIVTRPQLVHLTRQEYEQAGEIGTYLNQGYAISAMTALLNGDVLIALQPTG